MLLDTGRGRRRRRRRRRRGRGGGFGWGRLFRWLFALAILAAIGAGVYYYRAREDAIDARHDAAQRFAAAWAKGDQKAMWRELTPGAQRATLERRFVTAYANADRAAGVKAVKVGAVGEERDGRIAVPVTVRTDVFKTLKGTIELPVSGKGDEAGVDWSFALRLPGLRDDEAVVRRSGREPKREMIVAADGSALDATPIGASIAGHGGERPTGLEREFDNRLGGHPSAQLMFGDRVIARTKAVRGRPVRTTLRPNLMQAANAALGGKLGGVAVIRPSDGAVLALAGLAVSAPQPPGSTFKIITTAAALDHKVATPDSTYPVRTAATLSGVQLRNAGGEACGGSLTQSFVESCNSVFAPLGAKVGARRLVAAAKAFGFNEKPRIPAAVPNTISESKDLKDDLAVGAAAIGQDRDLATPLGMASVGATIALDGRRARPRVTTLDKVVRRRAVPRRVAGQVTDMMIGVVRGGTGTAAALPGVTVAGKTGTAELRPNSSNPKDADAWFVAFAPAERPRVAVAVMLVGAGFGGKAAAPVARQVLQAAL
ncbi:MAG TPA: penicillin-binding transpeptidase domain-containing protein [Solirubrobacteraceae bacterium]